MDSLRWFKSQDILVLRRTDAPGLKLIHQETKRLQLLDIREAAFWTSWDNNLANKGKCYDASHSLALGKFILRGYSTDQSLKTGILDVHVPKIRGGHVKWYAETSDLIILFNTQPMQENSPMLALGPYGSLCWRAVINGWSIGQIRIEAQKVFGCDEVIHFLRRLINLGFIRQIPDLNQINYTQEKTKKEFSINEVQSQLIHSLIPWYCMWEICTICDLRCKSCHLPKFESSGLDLERSLSIAQQIIEAGIFYVCIMGGEPLLRTDLEKIIEQMRVAGVFVDVISNGQKLTLDRAKALFDAGINQIDISFDGLSPQIHESSRGQGTYLQAIQAIHHAKQANIPRVGIVLTIHTGNIEEIVMLPKFMDESGVQVCHISLFKKTGAHGAFAPFNPINNNDRERLLHHLQLWKKMFPKLTIVLTSKPLRCTCGRTSFFIAENGDLRLCPFLYQNVENVFRIPLLEVWRSLEGNLPEDGPLGYCANENAPK